MLQCKRCRKLYDMTLGHLHLNRCKRCLRYESRSLNTKSESAVRIAKPEHEIGIGGEGQRAKHIPKCHLKDSFVPSALPAEEEEEIVEEVMQERVEKEDEE